MLPFSPCTGVIGAADDGTVWIVFGYPAMVGRHPDRNVLQKAQGLN